MSDEPLNPLKAELLKEEFPWEMMWEDEPPPILVDLAVTTQRPDLFAFAFAALPPRHRSPGETALEILPTQVAEIKKVIAQVSAAVVGLNLRLSALEARESEDVIELRELSPEETRKELIDYFKSNGTAYPSDAAFDLRFDAETVRDICAALVEEGLLKL